MVRDIMKDTAFCPKGGAGRAGGSSHGAGPFGYLASPQGGLRWDGSQYDWREQSGSLLFDNEGRYMVMFNPHIMKRTGPYEAEEGCLSLPGTRRTRRWTSIKVQYETEQFQTRYKTFTGWTAQIIQHEIDHCEGVVI